MADYSLGRTANSWEKGNVVTATKLNNIERDLTTTIDYINDNLLVTDLNDNKTITIEPEVKIKKDLVVDKNLTVKGNITLGSTENDVTTTTTIKKLIIEKFSSIATLSNNSGNNHKLSVNGSGQLYITIPTASNSTLGLVKIDNSTLTINDGVLSGAYVGGSNIQISGNTINATYSAGTNIQISNTGVISATDTTYGAATSSQLGLVKAGGSNITIASDGTINATDTTYSAATTSSLGLIQVGDNLAINDGILSGNYSVATTNANGLMSSTDKTKLDGITIISSITSQTVGTSIPTVNAISNYCEQQFMGMPANDSSNLADGTYILKLTVQTTNGTRTATYSWVAEGGE